MENKDNSGALFKSEKTSDKHPDYKGNCLVGGEVMYIAAWINESKKGDKYMSLTFTPQTEQAKYSKKDSDATPKPEFSKPKATPVMASDDDIPF